MLRCCPEAPDFGTPQGARPKNLLTNNETMSDTPRPHCGYLCYWNTYPKTNFATQESFTPTINHPQWDPPLCFHGGEYTPPNSQSKASATAKAKLQPLRDSRSTRLNPTGSGTSSFDYNKAVSLLGVSVFQQSALARKQPASNSTK